jgi:hypothetical protein
MENLMKFRQWINEKWFEYQQECEAWKVKSPSCKDANEYFRKNRWFLKRKYKEENDNIQH